MTKGEKPSHVSERQLNSGFVLVAIGRQQCGLQLDNELKMD
jgi:hypothetical protein